MSRGRIGRLIRKAIIVVLTLGAVGVGLNSVPTSGGQWWEITTWGTTSGPEPRFHLRMHSWCMVFESRTLHDPAGYGSSLPLNYPYDGLRGIAGPDYSEGYVSILSDSPSGPSVSTYRVRAWWCPGWLIAVLLATYPTIAFIHGPLRRHRRRKRGLCLTCGYDLTGNVTGECGKEIAAP